MLTQALTLRGSEGLNTESKVVRDGERAWLSLDFYCFRSHSFQCNRCCLQHTIYITLFLYFFLSNFLSIRLIDGWKQAYLEGPTHLIMMRAPPTTGEKGLPVRPKDLPLTPFGAVAPECSTFHEVHCSKGSAGETHLGCLYYGVRKCLLIE